MSLAPVASTAVAAPSVTPVVVSDPGAAPAAAPSVLDGSSQAAAGVTTLAGSPAGPGTETGGWLDCMETAAVDVVPAAALATAPAPTAAAATPVAAAPAAGATATSTTPATTSMPTGTSAGAMALPAMAGMPGMATGGGATSATAAGASTLSMPGMDMSGATSANDGVDDMAGMAGMHDANGAKAAGGMDMQGMKMPANPGAIMPMGKHGMAMKMRSRPVDAAKAQKLATAVTSFFAHVRKDQVDPGKNKTDQHFSIPKSMQQAFEKQYPGLNSPTTLVIDKKTGRPFGVMYMGDKQGGPNLPAGNSHRHHDGGAFMEHIWFTPNDMGMAYGDISVEDKAKKAVLG